MGIVYRDSLGNIRQINVLDIANTGALTNEIVAAIAKSDTNTIILIPSGQYLIDKVKLTHSIRMKGMNTILKSVGYISQPNSILISQTIFYTDSVDNVPHVELEGIEFDGGAYTAGSIHNNTGSPTRNPILDLNNVPVVIIKRCEFHYHSCGSYKRYDSLNGKYVDTLATVGDRRCAVWIKDSRFVLIDQIRMWRNVAEQLMIYSTDHNTWAVVQNSEFGISKTDSLQCWSAITFDLASGVIQNNHIIQTQTSAINANGANITILSNRIDTVTTTFGINASNTVCNNVTIQDNIINGTKEYGIKAQGDNTHIIHNTLTHTGSYGILFYPIAKPNSPLGVEWSYPKRDYEGVVIEDNYINGVKADSGMNSIGIRLSTDSAYYVKYSVIRRNIIYTDDTTNYPVDLGIYLDGGKNIDISDNQLLSYSQAGIKMRHQTGASVLDVQIKGNTFASPKYNSDDITIDWAGTQTDTVKNIYIQNNYFRSLNKRITHSNGCWVDKIYIMDNDSLLSQSLSWGAPFSYISNLAPDNSITTNAITINTTLSGQMNYNRDGGQAGYDAYSWNSGVNNGGIFNGHANAGTKTSPLPVGGNYISVGLYGLVRDSTTANRNIGSLYLKTLGTPTSTSKPSYWDFYGIPTNGTSPSRIGMWTGDGNLSTIGTIATGNATIHSGTGNPNNNVVGNVGDLFLRTDGGAGTTLYVKESGNGNNTGWVAK